MLLLHNVCSSVCPLAVGSMQKVLERVSRLDQSSQDRRVTLSSSGSKSFIVIVRVKVIHCLPGLRMYGDGG